MTSDELIVTAIRLFGLGVKVLREGNRQATPEEIVEATRRMDAAEDRLERVLRAAEQSDAG